VTPERFELSIFGMKTRRPSPLDDGAAKVYFIIKKGYNLACMKGLKRRYKIIAIFVILVVAYLIFRGRSKPLALHYAQVSQNTITSTISASGILSGKSTANLHFNTSGKLNYLIVKNGDIIEKGKLIATLDSTQLNSILQEAINTRRNTQANVDYIHDQVKDHSGDETFAQKASRTAAEVANDNAYDAVKSAQKGLQDTYLISPLSGVIITKDNINVGQNITPTDVIAEVIDFSEKDFNAKVDESDIGNIHVGQNAQITLNAYGDNIFNGTISQIEEATETDTTGAITITVKIKLNDSQISDIYGLNGNANIITSEKQNVLIIPQDALIDDSHVYIKNSKGQPEKREIKTGIKSDTDIEITSGLTAGEEVVTNPGVINK
jgi:RND family efflux transporter MFP subunit